MRRAHLPTRNATPCRNATAAAIPRGPSFNSGSRIRQSPEDFNSWGVCENRRRGLDERRHRCSQHGRGRREGSPTASTSEGSAGERLHPRLKSQRKEQMQRRPGLGSPARGCLTGRRVCRVRGAWAARRGPAPRGTGWAAQGNGASSPRQLKPTRGKPRQRRAPAPAPHAPTFARGKTAARQRARRRTAPLPAQQPREPRPRRPDVTRPDVTGPWRHARRPSPSRTPPPPGSTSMPNQRGKGRAPGSSRSSGAGSQGLRAAAPLPPDSDVTR